MLEKVIDDISFRGSRYSVGLPWKLGHSSVPSNYQNSLARLKSQLRKLKQSPDILEQYDNIFSEQLEAGIIEKVMDIESCNEISYLLHQAVCRKNAETTKIRVVFDAFCKDRKNGVSLNDCLHVGPSLTPLIFDILLRFRLSKVGFVGDIEKCFLNIEIHPEDKDCLRFLWVNDIHALEPKIVVYRMNRVTFGVNCSPFLLNAVLQHHFQSYQDVDPEFVRRMIEGFFVDDLVTGCSNTQEAYTLYKKARMRMLEGGFRLRKRKTNDKALGVKIAECEKEIEDKERKSAHEECSYAKETPGVSRDIGGKTKVLGIPWDSERDALEFDLVRVGHASNTTPTKRGILSTLATLFDPLGLVSPIGVVAKVLFQELCMEKVGWDDPLPQDKVARLETWLGNLKKTNTISIPRCVLDGTDGKILSSQLHGFADASKKAYCAMVFFVCETTQGTHTSLLCAKTRVAPLKQLTIPLLELMSARILATLMDTMVKALVSQFKVNEVKYWLDSKTALYWIYNNGEWKQFVQHRVNKILALSRTDDWGHVPRIENPADIRPRGMNAGQLNENVGGKVQDG